MKPIAKLYTDAVKDNLVTLFANWPPPAPVALGDYGVMEGNIFIRKGNVSEFGISFQELTGPSVDEKFSSAGSVDVAFTAKGTVPVTGATINAKISISFHKENAIYFSAEDCKTTAISNKNALGKTILEMLANKTWQKEWVIVTDVIQAERSIVAISAGNNAQYELQADASVSKIDIGTDLSVSTHNSVGFSVDALKGLNVLIGLCRVKHKFLQKPTFDHVSMSMMADAVHTRQAAPKADELYFGQMGL